MKTQTTISVEETNYHKAKEILNQMGLSYSQAIGVFNSMVVMNKRLPFEVKIPNKETKKYYKNILSKMMTITSKSLVIFNYFSKHS